MFTHPITSKTITQKREECTTLLKEYMNILHEALGNAKIRNDFKIEPKGVLHSIKTGERRGRSVELKVDKSADCGPVLTYFSGGNTSQYFKDLFSGDGFTTLEGGQLAKGWMVYYQEYGFCVKDENDCNTLLSRLENLKQNDWKLLLDKVKEHMIEIDVKHIGGESGKAVAELKWQKLSKKIQHQELEKKQSFVANKVDEASPIKISKDKESKTNIESNHSSFTYNGLSFSITQASRFLDLDVKEEGRTIWCPLINDQKTQKLIEITSEKDKLKYFIEQFENVGRRIDEISNTKIKEIFRAIKSEMKLPEVKTAPVINQNVLTSFTPASLPTTKEELQDKWAFKLMGEIESIDSTLRSMTIFNQSYGSQSKREKLYAEKIKLFDDLSAYKGTNEKVVKFISETARVVYMLKGIAELLEKQRKDSALSLKV
ncbi:MAG: hypothetical protein ACYCQI_15520 [Gammaproteobacteria bacterium]